MVQLFHTADSLLLSIRVPACVLGVLAAGSLARAQVTTCGTAGADAAIGDVSDVSNFAPSGGYDAMALGAEVCNMGAGTLAYSGCPNNHPVFGGNLYRLTTVNGAARFEQVGQSWVKHTAVAASASFCCTCSGGGGGLRGGCSDLYSSGFQAAQGTLGPRYQVNAFTGDFPACPPHPSGGNFGRLEVALTDLVPSVGGSAAATRYFAEEQVIAREDAIYTDATHPAPVNGLNNASNIELSVSGGPADYTFALYSVAGGTQRGTPAIRRWKQIDPSVTETIADVPGEGRFIVSSKATNLGGSPALWRYEYAVFNLNSDRCAGSFSVPVGSGAGASNMGFHTAAYRGGDGIGGVNVDSTPWASSVTDGALVWQTQDYSTHPNANALRWGTLSNFRFDTQAPPMSPAANGAVSIGLWKPGNAGTPLSISVGAQIPDCSSPVFLTQPESAAACPTGAAVFSAAATGSGLQYAWQIQTAPGVWQTVGNDPFPLSCAGGATGAFAYASPILSSMVTMGIRPCPGVSSYQVRCVVTATGGGDCGIATSNEVTYTVCPADFNCSGALSVQDIFDFLGGWFASDPHADINGTGGIEVQDIFDFLTAWFAGC